MKRISLSAILVAIALSLGACASEPRIQGAGNGDTRQVKNVIFLLSDGTANEAWPLARGVKGERLASDDILCGAIRTYGADSIITDSAPGSTSYATGQKGTDKGVAVYFWHATIAGVAFDPSLQYVPLATVLEGARLSGRATGIVATTNGHTGGNPYLFSYGPGRISGLWENSDIGKYIAQKLGFSFPEINQRLFVEASTAFQTAGFATTIDRTDPTNLVLAVSKGKATARLPLAKNLVLVNGKAIELEGLVVLAEKLDNVFLPPRPSRS